MTGILTDSGFLESRMTESLILRSSMTGILGGARRASVGNHLIKGQQLVRAKSTQEKLYWSRNLDHLSVTTLI